ncbi:MAG: hypothetical protein ACTSUW_03495 [Candidatus Heimdallarchaeota archaeon]|nr:hypothetical protein [Candidatus Heimdallarchaeota archaeon]MCK4291327.1 hypothetical protein [Candidatus Heimdallarchaeota archaeon]
MKFKTADAVHENSYKEFDEVYKKYGVKLVGGGYNSKDHKEIYFMSVFNDEAHYKETTEKLQSDPTYIELSKKLEVDREDVQIKTLEGFDI